MSMKLSRSLVAAALVVAVLAIGGRARAQDKAGVQAGFLTCHVSSGWGFVFGSSRSLHCTYSPKPGVTEHYTGSISKFGADIGYLQSAVILWAVVAPTSPLSRGALAGHYGGATADVTLGVGGGVNVLVGGFKKSIALQPISIAGNNGLNVAAGVGALTLVYQR